MQHESKYADTYLAYPTDLSHLYSLNIGDEDTTSEPLIYYSEQVETSYNNCTWRDMIFCLS